MKSIFFLSIIVLLGLERTVLSLYEDQVGMFDWTHKYVGEVQYVQFDHSSHQSSKQLLITTKENVFASVSAKTGELGWRVVFEKGDDGRIDDQINIPNYFVIVIDGGRSVRAFNPTTGNLLWEKTACDFCQKRAKIVVFGSDKDLVAVLSDSTVTVFEIESGYELWKKQLSKSDSTTFLGVEGNDDELVVTGLTKSSMFVVITLSSDREAPVMTEKQVQAPWTSTDTKCIFVAGSHFVCKPAVGKELHTLSMKKLDKFTTKSLDGNAQISKFEPYGAVEESSVNLFKVKYSENHVAVFSVGGGQAKLEKDLPGVSAAQLSYSGEKSSLFTIQRTSSEAIEFRMIELSGKDSDTHLSLSFPGHHGTPIDVVGHTYRKRDGSAGFRFLVISEDHSMVMFQQSGRQTWTREEALAGIVSVELVDLPVSKIMGKIEEEFNSNNDDLLTMFVRRFTTQFSQFCDYLHYLKNELRMPQHHHHHTAAVDDVEVDSAGTEDDEEEELTRDEFNLHKMMVAVTKPGKLFGIDTQSGRIIWMNYLERLRPYSENGDEASPIYQQRTSAHYGLEPQCTVMGQDRDTNMAIMYSFNPLNGKIAKGVKEEDVYLGYKIQQMFILNHMNDHFLRPLVVLDQNLKLHVYPASDTEFVGSFASQLFMFTVDSNSGKMIGYKIKSGNGDIHVKQLWTLVTAKQSEVVTNIVSKRAIEHVHSQGIVLGDRSVMYKYLNPNLVAITTEGVDNQDKGKAYFSLYLIDVVSGHVVFHCNHKKAKGPVKVVHSENWVVYSYWNQKHRRPEMAVVELYEGQKQTNATVFSSLNPPPLPIAMRQAFIFPGVVANMAATVTEKGITAKHILVGLESGGVLDLPKGLIDPRRPEKPTAESREEGLMPYVPELPRPSEAVINYNQTLHKLRAIHTAPAGLESTSIVVCYGLDIFVTRVNPSKMFDVLKEDFDYLFIGSVLVGIVSVSFISQKLAARKALNRTWK